MLGLSMLIKKVPQRKESYGINFGPFREIAFFHQNVAKISHTLWNNTMYAGLIVYYFCYFI